MHYSYRSLLCLASWTIVILTEVDRGGSASAQIANSEQSAPQCADQLIECQKNASAGFDASNHDKEVSVREGENCAGALERMSGELSSCRNSVSGHLSSETSEMRQKLGLLTKAIEANFMLIEQDFTGQTDGGSHHQH